MPPPCWPPYSLSHCAQIEATLAKWGVGGGGGLSSLRHIYGEGEMLSGSADSRSLCAHCQYSAASPSPSLSLPLGNLLGNYRSSTSVKYLIQSYTIACASPFSHIYSLPYNYFSTLNRNDTLLFYKNNERQDFFPVSSYR